MRETTRHILPLLALAAMVSCSKSTENEDFAQEVEKCGIEIQICTDTMDGQTRSSFTWDDQEMRDIQVIVTDDRGKTVEVIKEKTNGQYRFEGTKGQKYILYAGVNSGADLAGSSTDNISGLRLNVDYGNISTSGMPMFNETGIAVTAGIDASATIPVKRMMARIDFRVDRSMLSHADPVDGFKVKSVRIFNAINHYSPFMENRSSKADGIPDYAFDYASAEDIILLNSGGTISMYAFENLQGTALPGNTDPWKKVPSSIDGAELCSYLEVKASYHAQGLSSEDITYRMYLGEDSTTNFDVRRNRIYTVSLKPTEEEIDGHRASWKVMSRNWNDIRSLSVVPSSITVPSLSSASFTLTMSPSVFEYVISGDGWLQESGCTVTNDAASRKLTVTNTRAIDRDTHGKIVVSSWDGSVAKEVDVTVKMTNRETGRDTVYGDIVSFDLTAGSDIPASGGSSGSCSISNVMQETWERIRYLDGSVLDTDKSTVRVETFTPFYSKSSSSSFSQQCPAYSGSSLGTTLTPRKAVGNIYAYVSANGRNSQNKSVEIFQQENRVESSELSSTVSLGLNYGDKQYYRQYAESRNHFINADSDSYSTSTDPAPASGGTARMTIAAGHEERDIYLFSRSWSRDVRKNYTDTYTSGSKASRSVTEQTDSGTDYGQDESDWTAVDDQYSTSGSASGFSFSSGNVNVESLGTQVSSGRSCTYTFTNRSDSQTKAEVTIYQGPNDIESTVPEHYEYSDYKMSLSDYTVPGNGYNLVSISGTVKINSISELTVYTSGAKKGGELKYGWNATNAVWPEAVSTSPGSGLNFKTSVSDGKERYNYIYADDNPTHSRRSWTITGTYEGMQSSVTLEQEASTVYVPSLTPDASILDTWGGNSYPVTFTYMSSDGSTRKVTPDLEKITYTQGAPNSLISFSGSSVVAADWWGMTGSWITRSPSYTATFTYEGASAEISGTMHGTTGFSGMGRDDFHFLDAVTLPDGSSARLEGSESIDISGRISCSLSASASDYSGGYLKVGSYSLNYSAVDPTNGITRSGRTDFSVLTNVVSVSGSITTRNSTYGSSNNQTLNSLSCSDGGILATITITTNGHDETTFTVDMTLSYTDIHGAVHNATAPVSLPDYGSLPAASASHGVVPHENTVDEYEINGFVFKIIWRAG